jgi:RNA polymerase sigma-70 factor (ECF subfamily)
MHTHPLATPEAFEAAVMPHLGALRAYANRLGPDPDDLVQETLLRAWRARYTYLHKSGHTMAAWLHRILRNVHIDDCRHRNARHRIPAWLCAPLDAALQVPAPSADVGADVVGLREAFRTLRLPWRRILWLIDVMGYSHPEVARIMGLPHNTVSSRASRARARLRRRMST